MKKEKAIQCAYTGCENKHKSSTGYCADHVQFMDKKVVRIVKRPVGAPMLHEERGYYDRDV